MKRKSFPFSPFLLFFLFFQMNCTLYLMKVLMKFLSLLRCLLTYLYTYSTLGCWSANVLYIIHYFGSKFLIKGQSKEEFYLIVKNPVLGLRPLFLYYSFFIQHSFSILYHLIYLVCYSLFFTARIHNCRRRVHSF